MKFITPEKKKQILRERAASMKYYYRNRERILARMKARKEMARKFAFI